VTEFLCGAHAGCIAPEFHGFLDHGAPVERPPGLADGDDLAADDVLVELEPA
jgi:hypothetical protein